MAEFLRCDINKQIARLTLNRPDLHNALNDVFMAEIEDAVRRLGEDDNVRAIILAAEGKSFCAGADVNWMKRMVGYSVEENIADAMVLSNMLRRMRECPKPIIARVHGAAIGGGVGLTAACDMAVATTAATFCLSEVRLGILPAVISPFVTEKIGLTHARRYALTAERFDGLEAKRIGLVSEAVDTVEALDWWIDQVTTAIRSNGPAAVAACKSVLSDIQPFDWNRAQKLTTERLAHRRVSPEGQEGLKAFLEKRKPAWATE